MFQLERNLCSQFGINSCLTGNKLDWSSLTKFSVPSDTAGSLRSHNSACGLHDQEKLLLGQGITSIGSLGSMSMGYEGPEDGAFLYGVVARKPTDKHYSMPRQLSHLAPILRQFSLDFHAHAPHASTYYCGFMYRSLPLLTEQIAENWHNHKIFSTKTVTPRRVKGLEIPERSVSVLEDIASDMVAVEYLVSDRLGSLVQAEPVSEPLNIVESDGDYTALDMPEGSYRQLKDGEMARGNSYVFHRAANVPDDMVGDKRSLLAVAYLPSKATKIAMGL